tara:strand:+ start:1172 stop:2062 length:891 start_codon:yes stop_codon:yes gene_type:complete
MNRLLLSIIVLLIACYFVFYDLVQGDWGNLSNGWDNLSTFWNESLWPPDWAMLQAQTYPECNSSIGFFCSKAYLGMLETIKMAFVATVLGFSGAILLSPLAARNLVPLWVSVPARIVLAATRSLPSLIWAIIFVVIFGLGPLAGVLAMTFYTIGYLGKFQYEEMEGIRNEPLEAARAMGLSRAEIAVNVVIPESSNSLLSQLLFMFEYNVRHGTVLGLVGAGGIGYYLQYYMGLLLYHQVMAFLVVIFVVVVFIDLLSMFLRSFVNEEGDVKRPTWSTIFLPPSVAASLHHDDESN